jgi:Zn-dependent peptidase ImmA (M78 family)
LNQSKNLLEMYSVRKQILAEISKDLGVSKKTIHRKITTALVEAFNTIGSTHVNPSLSSYTSSVLILDATFFGRKGSEIQW